MNCSSQHLRLPFLLCPVSTLLFLLLLAVAPSAHCVSVWRGRVTESCKLVETQCVAAHTTEVKQPPTCLAGKCLCRWDLNCCPEKPPLKKETVSSNGGKASVILAIWAGM